MPLFDLFIQFRFRYLKNLGNSIIDFFSQIKGLFRTFGITDVVDILFVAIVIYLVVRVIRETRAMQLIKGFLLLTIVYLVVTFLGMGASSYIMRMIFNNILIILVILFGPEIRKILEETINIEIFLLQLNVLSKIFYLLLLVYKLHNHNFQ